MTHLNAGTDLEAALQAVRPTERQTHFIASATREFLLPSDLAVLSALLADRHHLPLSRLYRHLFDSTHTTLHVVTPNYDRLAEYAADAADVSSFTGFNYGYLQSRARDPRTRITIRGRETRTVAIWKVYGSLDWFQDAAKQIVGIRSAFAVPPDYAPLMITPGIDKYRLTHGEPFRRSSGAAITRWRMPAHIFASAMASMTSMSRPSLSSAATAIPRRASSSPRS
ncbi:hypothetical protein [Mesorhizobium sp. GR13]|uniref:hypothetical protein n=1 Tax=Mesorhizobium sp. GR13 TaxID=2562308 RepID=UPI0010C14DB0|nr:hypothetical protein [Mesorhizobium sp. GR13]